MSAPLNLKIDPAQRILTGESAGRATRDELGLDAVDRNGATAVVRIETPVVTSTFIEGLIGQSVRALGLDAFEAKYRFDVTPSVRESIHASARRVLDDAA